MPRLSGHLLAEQLTPQRPRMKVLFVSGYNEHMPLQAVMQGKAHVLAKPIHPDALLEKVRAVLAS